MLFFIFLFTLVLTKVKTNFKNYLLHEISMNNDIVSRLVCVVNISIRVGVLVCICLFGWDIYLLLF